MRRGNLVFELIFDDSLHYSQKTVIAYAMNFWQQIKKPIKLLAPMAGYTDSVFRSICKDFGADAVMTELISADAIYFALKKSKEKLLKSKTYSLMQFQESERPVVIQLFGKDPEKFIVAAGFIETELKADGIDLNLGCSVKKVLKSGHGAALLNDIDQAVLIIKSLKESTKLSISVKTRTGFSDQSEILKFGPELAAAGADAIIVHGRTAKQGFAGEADWTNIYKLKEMLPDTIIIGNGDIKKYDDIIKRVKNLDGVAIGRAALGRPWIFSGKEPKSSELVKLIRKQARLAYKMKGKQGIIELRKHLVWYFKGFENALELRKASIMIESLEDVERILHFTSGVGSDSSEAGMVQN